MAEIKTALRQQLRMHCCNFIESEHENLQGLGWKAKQSCLSLDLQIVPVKLALSFRPNSQPRTLVLNDCNYSRNNFLSVDKKIGAGIGPQLLGLNLGIENWFWPKILDWC